MSRQIIDAKMTENRFNSLKNKTKELIDKPQIKTVTMSNDIIHMRVSINS